MLWWTGKDQPAEEQLTSSDQEEGLQCSGTPTSELLLCGVAGVWKGVATEAGENSELRHETDLCLTT